MCVLPTSFALLLVAIKQQIIVFLEAGERHDNVITAWDTPFSYYEAVGTKYPVFKVNSLTKTKESFV